MQSGDVAPEGGGVGGANRSVVDAAAAGAAAEFAAPGRDAMPTAGAHIVVVIMGIRQRRMERGDIMVDWFGE